MAKTVAQVSKHQTKQHRILYQLESWLETPMFMLALVWLWLFVEELIEGLSPFQEKLVVVIWILFIAEFLLKLFLAPHKLRYIKRNWLTLIALVIPAFRAFRLVNAIRVLRASRVVTTTRFVRALTSTKRFVTDIKEVQGPRPSPEMHVGVLLAHSPSADKGVMEGFAKQLLQDVRPEIEAASGTEWFFHMTEEVRLESDSTRQPSDFLDDASLRMAEGPFDLVVVVTDVPLMSRRRHVEPGLSSPTSRVLVISSRKLLSTPRGRKVRTLLSPSVRWNAATLLLHLLGHIGGLSHQHRSKSAIMAPFEFRENLQTLPRFTAEEKKLLRKGAEHLPERELRGGNVLESLIFHIVMALRHPKKLFLPLWRNHALLLPLSLPGLATAAFTPTFLLVFTAEIWDAGLNMDVSTIALFAVATILAASFYLISVQGLFLPRKEKRVLTEHLAVANVVIFLSILLACIGLFVMVAALMLVMEVYIFPEGLMKTWPTLLEQPEIDTVAKLKLAAFISTIGVATGALAGGFDSKTVIQHLALFESRP